jgi:RNA polymerase sigma-70 factor (ECF subfamily)
VARALAGEDWAFEGLYRRYVTIVARTVSRLLRSTSDTEDVVQETFSIAFRKLGQLEDVGALRVWIVRIGVSRAHRVLSKRRMFSWLTGEEAATTLAEQAAQGGVSGEDRAELALLDRALSTIAPDRRTPWILRHFLGYPIEEVASICGYSHTTAKRRIADVDAHVRRHLHVKGEKP